MPTISTRDFTQLAATLFTSDRIHDLTTKIIKIKKKISTVDLAKLSDTELNKLISAKETTVDTLTQEKEHLENYIRGSNENSFWSRFKRTMKHALVFSIIGLLVLPPVLMYMIVSPVVASALIFIVYPVVFLSCFVLSAPFIWFFDSKTNENLNKMEKISGELGEENRLLETLKEEKASRTEKSTTETPQQNPEDVQNDKLYSLENKSTLFSSSSPKNTLEAKSKLSHLTSPNIALRLK